MRREARLWLAALALVAAVVSVVSALNEGNYVAFGLGLSAAVAWVLVLALRADPRPMRVPSKPGPPPPPPRRPRGARLMGDAGEHEARTELLLALHELRQGRPGSVNVSFTVERGEASGEMRDELRLELPRGTFYVMGPRLMHSWGPRWRDPGRS